MKAELPEQGELYTAVLEELDELLRVGYPDDAQQRQRIATGLLENECRNLGLAADSAVSEQQWGHMVARCRYYAAQELLSLHCARQLAWALDQREDLLLYLQDQLMRDDFRRLRLYQADRGARLRTWLSRVLDNLTRDFLRRALRRGQQLAGWRESAQEDDQAAIEALDAVPQSAAVSATESLAQEQMQHFLQQVFSDPTLDQDSLQDGLRDRLAAVLQLQASERLFLKMIYFSELNPEDAGARLGMNKNQSYGLQRRLLQRIAAACKSAGLWQDIQDFLELGEVRLEIVQDGQSQRLSPDQLRHLAKSSANRCELWWAVDHQQAGQKASVEQPFGTLHRKLYGHTSLIQSAECVADAHVMALHEDQAQLSLRNLTLRFPVHQRYIKVIRALLRQNTPAHS